MTPKEAVAHMLEKSGRTKSSVSLALGKHRNFVVCSMGREPWNPAMSTLTGIAGECGYKVVLEGNGERIVLE